MKNDKPQPRRKRVPGDLNRNIYLTAAGKYEVGYKDAAGKQRWKTVNGGKMAARKVRDELLAQRAKGEQPADNRRLRFGAAADAWEAQHVVMLRERTQDTYRAHLDRLRARFSTARLDRLTPGDFASFVREMRDAGLAEWTIHATLQRARQVYDYAGRRLGWSGRNPIDQLDRSERAKLSQTKRKVIFTEAEVRQTIDAASEPFKTLFTVAARTGARVSEICGLRWAYVELDDLDDADLRIEWQLSNDGLFLAPLKTDGSARTLPIDRDFAETLTLFKHARGLDGYAVGPDDFVFSTRSARAITRRNVSRALRAAQKAAVKDDGQPAFRTLHEVDETGKSKPVAAGVIPSMHSFRHSYVSYGLRNGVSLFDLSRELGHSSPTVTGQIYAHEINDAGLKTRRRARMADRASSATATQAVR